jgi:signal transduction histidine kinase
MAGMVQFGRDTLWAAIAFAWYGLIGQAFPPSSPIYPSYIMNEASFLATFGFPVQILRAVSGAAASAFVVRFLRAFEVETQRKLIELQELRLRTAEDREARRSAMLRQVVSAQEAERQRVARELHDETGQALTAIGLGLRGIAGTLHGDPDHAMEGLGQLEKLVSHSLDELQRLIADLRPSHIDDLGLPAALRWYAGEFRKRTGLNISLDIHGDPPDIPGPINIAVFRIAQEALTNITKHAQATAVQMCLSFQDDWVSLDVQDDGRGFNPSDASQNGRTSWGLMGMRERARLLDGQLVLESKPGQGTHIQVRIPTRTQEQVIDEDSFIVGG